MLKEISDCRNFADISKCLDILEVIKKNKSSLQNLKSYFNDDVIIRRNFDDTIFLLHLMDFIKIEDEMCIIVNSNIVLTSDFFIKCLLDISIKNNLVDLLRIDNDFFFSIDSENYALRNLLLFENILSKYSIYGLYLVNPIFAATLDKFRKKINKDEFIRNLEKQSEYGEKAELFVIEYERKILNNKLPIVHVALEDTSAGYDIKSYLNENSIIHDKFIEVKCYSNDREKIFISRNEIETSKNMGKNYFLYLLDSSFSNDPIIIQNPYKGIFGNREINYNIESVSYKVSDVIKTKKKT